MNDTNIISIRYGESLKLSTTLNSDMADLASLTFYIALEGEVLPLVTIPATILDGVATIYEQKLLLPIGTYKYQYTAVFNDGSIEKFPSVEATCSCDESTLPSLVILEALDIVEIS